MNIILFIYDFEVLLLDKLVATVKKIMAIGPDFVKS